MLAPHHREDAQLGVARLAAEDGLELLVFLGREVVLLHQFGSDGWARSSDVKSRGCKSAHEAAAYAAVPPACSPARESCSRKSVARPRSPGSASLARSGCGIRPATLRCSLQMPAMLSSEPFGLAVSVGFALRIHVAPEDLVVGLELGQGFLVRKVTAFAVGDRHAQSLSGGIRLVNGESAVAVFRKTARSGTAASGCESAPRAAARPRRESETRCRCPAPARRRRRTAAPPASPG